MVGAFRKGLSGQSRADARAALERFWSGKDRSWEHLEAELRGLGVSGTSARALRLNLPVPETQGPTASRIQRAARLLEILEGG